MEWLEIELLVIIAFLGAGYVLGGIIHMMIKRELKDIRQEKFNSKAAIMLEEVKRLKMLIFELEEPLEAFDEKLFLEIVKSIQINKEDEMSVELLGGLRFRERI